MVECGDDCIVVSGCGLGVEYGVDCLWYVCVECVWCGGFGDDCIGECY